MRDSNFSTRTCHWARWVLAALFLVSALPLKAPAQQPLTREYQIRAVFLYNFTQFVQWPAEAFPDPGSPFVIGVVGHDPFGSFLDETIRQESVGNHRLVVERYASVDEIENPHILYIGMTDKQDIKLAMDKMNSKAVLTVSDTEGFARMGGMIRFYSEEGRIKLRINAESASHANLVLSSKLLRLAEIVPGKNN